MKKKFSVFYLIYFTVFAMLFVALFTGLHYLKQYLTEYEAAQPVHKMEQIIEEYFKVEDKNLLLSKSTYRIPKHSSAVQVLTYLGEIIDEENIDFYSVSTGDENALSYAVTSGDLKVATVNLIADETGKFKTYVLSSIELTIGGSDAVKIKAPIGYTVFVNAIPLTEAEMTDEREETESCKHMYDSVNGIVYVTYKVDGLFGAPVVTASDKNGSPVENIESDSAGVNFKVPVVYSEMTEDQKAEVLAASEAYAAYMQNDAGFAKIGQYVDKSSSLYSNLRTSQTMWVIDHNGYSIENPVVSEFYRYDDNTFSCRIRFTHILHRRGATDYKNSFDMTFYYRNVNGKFLIYDSQVN